MQVINLVFAQNDWINKYKTFILVLSCSLVYTCTYLSHDALPGNNLAYPSGWWGWSDQGIFLREAQAIATGKLNSATYRGPIGYPLLGAAFIKILPNHPYFFVNLICYIFACVLFIKICERYISQIESALLLIFLILFNRHFGFETMTIPWSNNVCIPVFYYVFLKFILNSGRERDWYLISTLTILVYHVRMLEFAILSLMLLIPFIMDTSRNQKVKIFVYSICLFSVLQSAILFVNYNVFGNYSNSYNAIVKGIGFFGYDVAVKLYTFMFRSNALSSNPDYLLRSFPYILFILPGLFFLYQKIGLKLIGFMFCGFSSVFLYMNYNDLWITNLYRFYNLRYFIWILPLLGFIAYLSFRKSWIQIRIPLAIILLLIPSLLFLLRLDQVNLSKDIITLQSDKGKPLTYEAKFADKTRFDILQFPELPIDYNSVDKMKLLVDGATLMQFKDFYLLPSQNSKTIIFSKQVSPCKIQLTFSDDIPLQKHIEIKSAKLKFNSIFNNQPPLYYNSYVYGDELNFSKIDYLKSNRYIVKGFSAQELNSRWSEGSESILNLGLEKTQSAKTLQISGKVFGEQIVKVYFNSELLYNSKISDSNMPISIEIPSYLITLNNELKFQFPNCCSPKSLGLSLDPRLLGISFEKVVLK
jgi:hypothetical protein